MAEEEELEVNKRVGVACEGSRQELIKCLKESDCVRVVSIYIYIENG